MERLPKMNIEKMLTLAAESSKLSIWNDALSKVVDRTVRHYETTAISEDMLESVAGGLKLPEQDIDKNSKKD